MTEKLRFVLRYEPAPEFGPNTQRQIKVLQYSDGSTWFDVPYVDPELEKIREETRDDQATT